MKKENSIPFTDPVYLTGIFFVFISLLIYWITGNESFRIGNDNDMGFFFVTYGIAAIYFLLLIIKGFVGFRFPVIHIKGHYFIPMLILLVISAFTLNREVCVFEKMTSWVSALLVVQCTVFLVFPGIDRYPNFIRYILCFITAFSLPVMIYFSIFLMPYYAFALLGSFLMGITLHVFVPLTT